MGQAAARLDAIVREAGAIGVIPFKTSAAPARPTLVSAQGADLPALLGMISRVASLLNAQKERTALLEKRCLLIEDQLKAANAKIADTEPRLKAAIDEARAEKARANEVHRRSSEVVEKSRALLTDASERIRTAEGRAERAESSFTSIRDAFEHQIGPQLR